MKNPVAICCLLLALTSSLSAAEFSNGKFFHHRGDTQDRSWSEPAWYPQTNGMRGMSSHDPETTRRLSETRQRGRIYESPDVADDAYFDGQVAQKTIEDLRRLKKAGEPFFLACGFGEHADPVGVLDAKGIDGWDLGLLCDLRFPVRMRRPEGGG